MSWEICHTIYLNFRKRSLMGKGELVALLNLSSWCLVMVEPFFLTVPLGCLQFVIVVFPDHTHLLFLVDITMTDGRYHKDCSGIAIILKKIQLITLLLLTIIQLHLRRKKCILYYYHTYLILILFIYTCGLMLIMLNSGLMSYAQFVYTYHLVHCLRYY